MTTSHRTWILAFALSASAHAGVVVVLGVVLLGRAPQVRLPSGEPGGVRVRLATSEVGEADEAPAGRPPVETQAPPTELTASLDASVEVVVEVAHAVQVGGRALVARIATGLEAAMAAAAARLERLAAALPDAAPGPAVVRGPVAAAANRPPIYPRDALRQRESGTVLLRLVIEADGSVSGVSVARSSGVVSLDASAAEAARGWRFEPAVDRGVAIRCEVDVPVDFVLG